MEWVCVEKDSVKRQPYPEMYKPHAHRKWEIYYLKSGERKYFIEDKVYPIEPGDFAFISTYTLHKTIGRD